MALFFRANEAREYLHLLSQPDGAGLYSASQKILVKHWDLDAEDLMPIITPGNMPVLVHARLSSSGAKKSEANTHPFRFGSFVFAHNGTIDRFKLMQELDIKEPDVINKLVALTYRSDSSLLAECLKDATIEQAKIKLAPYVRCNNFLCYSEREEKFLALGIYSLRANKGFVQSLIVNCFMEYSTSWTRVTGMMVISKEGRIIQQSTKPYTPPKKELEPEQAFKPGQKLQDYWKSDDRNYFSTLEDVLPDLESARIREFEGDEGI